jgi:hypothetical protein
MTGNAGRIAGHGITNTAHNALATHNQLNGARNQWAHNQLGHNQFAHNQFAAQNFHGLNNFNHTGFNRNAFGNNANWNHWGEHFWGAGWNNWGWGWGGWAGPVFWPFLLGDVFSFVFWPYAYYDPFWWYGPPFIFASIFAPGPYFGLDYGYGPDYYGYGYGPDYSGYAGSPNIYYDSSRGYNTAARGRYAARTEQADRQALAETNTAALESCAGLARRERLPDLRSDGWFVGFDQSADWSRPARRHRTAKQVRRQHRSKPRGKKEQDRALFGCDLIAC